MAIEIERKFLVDKTKWHDFVKPPSVKYSQGYITNERDKVVRVRVAGPQGYVTIKGGNLGIKRSEFEYEIPVEDAEQLLTEFCPNTITKHRYKILFENKTWEVDEFLGDNQGLVVAEIELKDEKELFKVPGWVGKEVSDDERYYNSNLSIVPYKKWKSEL